MHSLDTVAPNFMNSEQDRKMIMQQSALQRPYKKK